MPTIADDGAMPASLIATLCARVLYKDVDLLVLDKPAGLAVHPGPRTSMSVEAALPGLTFGNFRKPKPAHRLDRDTSGCLILGRHPKALKRLGALFTEGKVGKVYWAVVIGDPMASHGTIDKPLKKLNSPRGWKVVVDPEGQKSVTDWTVLGRADGIAWLELRPRTGRTHQVRVHCAAMGWPLVGDPVYGDGRKAMHLHAREVTIPYHPARAPVTVVAPPPEHMHAALIACGAEIDTGE